MNLLLLDAREVAADGTVCLDDRRADHVVRVLKAAPGDRLRVGLIDGAAGSGVVTGISPGQVRLRCEFSAAPAPPPVDLLLALPRPKVLRRLWAQLAAIGVGRIILTNAARVERNYFDTHLLDETSYRPLLIEGLQQARDTRVPAVTVRRQLKILIEDELDGLCPDGLRVVAHPGGHPPVTTVVRDATPGRVLLAVGPEGGWTSYELGLLDAHGFRLASAGERPLRTDTACVALLSLVHDALTGRDRPRDQPWDEEHSSP